MQSVCAPLLPCPKCGDSDRQLSDDNYMGWLYAVCNGCGHTQPGELAIEEAEAATLNETPWPTHPDGRPKRMGEMIRDERQAQFADAVSRVGRELAGTGITVTFDQTPPETLECDWCGREYLPHSGKLDHCCPACNAAYRSVYQPKVGAA